MAIRATGEMAYFAASNSERGFCSYYKEIFDAARIGRVFAVKGGPGTGKSRFLRDVAAYAEGRGWRCEYIYCSSDPDSLDAVILSRDGTASAALLDATAPHLYEPTLPGAREDIVNLGAFWDSALLASHVEEIEGLGRAKSDAYRRAYRYLAGFGEMSRNRDALVLPYVRRTRIREYARRLLEGIACGVEYTARPALIHSLGMRGEVGFDTYFAEAKRIYTVEDCRGAARYMMEEICERARELRLSVLLSHDPVEPDRLDGIFLSESGIAFAVCRSEACEYPHRRISVRRFVDTAAMRAVRGELNYTERMRRAMRCGAVDAMERVRELHFRLEDIYVSSMDFEAKEAYTKDFCMRHFS